MAHSGGDIMKAENYGMSGKYPGGWTLIVLLIVVAIIALLMAIYLPSVLQMYSPSPSCPLFVVKKG